MNGPLILSRDITISLIVAVAENGVIGRGGALPWQMPSDLKTFRRLTLDKPVVMGRKTYASIGRPLDRRDNIVVTRGLGIAADPDKRLFVTASLEQALVLARQLAAAAGATEVMVIGGAEIYRAALPLADRIYLTRIHARVEGDATFADPAPAEWKEVAREAIPRGEKDEHPATLLVFECLPDAAMPPA